MKNIKKVDYMNLNQKEKEEYNYFKIASRLVDFGLASQRTPNDWGGIDFAAFGRNGEVFKCQLKSRLHFDKKYQNRDIWITFIDRKSNELYFFPHDEVLKKIKGINPKPVFLSSKSWIFKGGYSFPNIPKQFTSILRDFIIPIV